MQLFYVMRMSGSSSLGAAMAVLFLFTAGCRSTYYKTMEKFGYEKRDLLKENVEEVRDEQAKTAEQFKDALTRLRELYAIDGGDLEKTYDQLQKEFERSQSRADAVGERIEKMEQVASDLFKEWEQEIETIQSSRLASDSRSKLRDTRQKYESMYSAMKRAETSMEPVLGQFRDQVLYLKHNLNAQAIGALKEEALDIDKEIQQLIQDMNASIQKADAFIQGLE